jgi:hypothetical protein
MTDSSLSALPPNWTCLADSTPEAQAPPTAPTYTFTGFVLDYRDQQPLSGASLSACSINDVSCERVVAVGVPSGPLTPNGPPSITVPLPAGFVGFLRLTAPNYVIYDYYVGGPVTRNVVATQPFTLVSLSSFAEFATGLGADPAVAGTQGALAVQILDCNNDPAPEVELRLSDPARPSLQNAELWAAQGLIPVPNQPTDRAGVAGFINLPSENVAVEAFVAGKTFGGRSFRIQAGRLTTGTMRPQYVNGL